MASVRSKWNGSRAPVIRHNFSVPDRRKLRIERLYGRPYPGASCDKDLKFSDLTYLNEPVVFEYKVTLPRFVRHEGEEWKLKPLKGFLRGRLGTLFPNRFSDLASVAKREHDLVFSQRWSFRADQSYDLPEGMKVVTKPENVDVTTKFGRLVITYEVEGRSLKVSKQLSLETVRVAAEDYQEFRRFCNEVDEKEFREIILGTE